ncbi:AAA family ATPase [Sphingobacterium sp. SYP-B4668]|uniref:AAA family ATPase n=1 Tax=Sphingobacterium sp. SYP-B4668 TaxID=2996035 RepID=UPI0022DD3226|nr:ATP-binding protein [Sphingobacterium sp. SYP-B4668]
MSVYNLILGAPKKVTFDDLLFSTENRDIISQIIKEHHYIDELQKYGLTVDNKILLYGYSGCGKTSTAIAIANAMDRPLNILNLSTLVSSKLGETASNLKAIFDKVAREKSILFLDEFDQIGKMRIADEKDSSSGEMRRVVNTLIQLIDYFPADCLLICATNYYDLIDAALLRRFQLRLKYEMPSEQELDVYYQKILQPFPMHLHDIAPRYDISYAEARDYVHTLMKSRIIAELESKVLVDVEH